MLKEKIKTFFNSQTKTAEVYYARSITHGIAAYDDGNTLITKEALDRMNDSFVGKPVVITHENWRQQDPVGYVVKSFWLPQDGYYWVEFIINDDRALNFIRRNARIFVSNGYEATEVAGGGTYHQIEYSDEVINGQYLHLALTERPKFKEAIVLTRQEFKEFNKKLSTIDNKFNEEGKMKFFKKKEVDNSEEILKTSFELNGQEFTVESMINTLKTKLNEENAKIKVADGVEMTKDELVAKYNELSAKLNEEAQAKEAEEKAKAEAEEKAKKEAEEKAKAEEEAKKKAEEKAKAEEKKNEEEELKKKLEKANEEAGKVKAEKWQLVNGKLTKIEE